MKPIISAKPIPMMYDMDPQGQEIMIYYPSPIGKPSVKFTAKDTIDHIPLKKVITDAIHPNNVKIDRQGHIVLSIGKWGELWVWHDIVGESEKEPLIHLPPDSIKVNVLCGELIYKTYTIGSQLGNHHFYTMCRDREKGDIQTLDAYDKGGVTIIENKLKEYLITEGNGKTIKYDNFHSLESTNKITAALIQIPNKPICKQMAMVPLGSSDYFPLMKTNYYDMNNVDWAIKEAMGLFKNKYILSGE